MSISCFLEPDSASGPAFQNTESIIIGIESWVRVCPLLDPDPIDSSLLPLPLDYYYKTLLFFVLK